METRRMRFAGETPRAISRGAEAERAEPGYRCLWRTGELRERVESAWRRLADCDLCPRGCHVDRRRTNRGAVCRTGVRAVVASFQPHFGEEACLVGRNGSGTIFFSWCNLRCRYCQNADIAHHGIGRVVEPEDVAAMMLHLQDQGCLNINLVTPTHVVPQILAAVAIAAAQGLARPLVYNTGGYDAVETLRLLDGVVDIYMPDMKYAAAAFAREASRVRDYPAVNQAAVLEMHRQVGDLVIDAAGIARRGLLVRHLVLPNGLAGTAALVRFLAADVSPRTALNLMDQYRPCFEAWRVPGLSRRLSAEEFTAARRLVAAAGLRLVG